VVQCSTGNQSSAGHDTNQLDGNNSHKLLWSVGKLVTARLAGPEAAEDSEPLLPDSTLPIMETMSAFIDVVEATMSHKLSPNYSQLIGR
jgi:hypothetical protein